MVIVGLLLIIVAILLFGAGAVGNAISAVATVILLLLGVGLLAYGVDWNGAPVWPAVMGLLGIGAWVIWKVSQESDQ